MTVRPKTYNLNERIPNVLFIGNGIDYHDDYKWHKVIENVSENKKNIQLLSDENDFQVPNTILTFALAPMNDKDRRKKYVDAIKEYPYHSNSNIEKLMNMPFDAILTTNYTYELEHFMDNRYPSYSDKKKLDFVHEIKFDPKYLIHTYNQIGNSCPIWHIHGELRRKSSVILAHDEY